MSAVGIVSMMWGAIALCARGPLLIAPAAMLRGYKAIVKTSTRTRILGTCLVLLAAPTIWAGNSEESILATVLLFLGWAIVLASVPALVLFPRVYMSIAGGMLPDDATGTLFGWRLLGLVGMIIGVALFRAGMLAL